MPLTLTRIAVLGGHYTLTELNELIVWQRARRVAARYVLDRRPVPLP